jgi:MFS family permease
VPAPLASDLPRRRLVLLVGAIVFVDTMFYAAIAPLLPTLAHQLHLSKLSAGVMTACYPVGTFFGSLPGGLLTVRIGPKRTVYAGLALLAVSTVAFGWAHGAAALDLARLAEGVGGACSWAGALAWIVAESPATRRGQTMGGAIGAAIGGALFGPVIGTLASAIGRGPAFSGVVVLAVLLIDQSRRIRLTHSPSAQRIRDAARALPGTGALRAVWLVALPSLAAGVLNVLGPLRLHRLGAVALAIGAIYLVASAMEAVLSALAGRLSDRRGPLVPVRAGLAGTAIALACFTLPGSALGLAILVVATASVVAGFWAPAMTMLSDAAELGGVEQGFAAALVNMAWAAGQTVGAVAGGAIAKAAGDGVPTGATAGLCLVTLLIVGWRSATAPAAGDGTSAAVAPGPARR